MGKPSPNGITNHRFDPITNICTKCGVYRYRKPYVGDSYNLKLINRFENYYSIDGINFT